MSDSATTATNYSRKIAGGLLACLLAITGCASDGPAASEPAGETAGDTATENDAPETLRIGYQNGLIYAPVVVASNQDCFDRELPGTDVTLTQLNSGGSLRDAHLAGDLDVGIYGLGAFLVGWDAGVEWQAIESVAETPLRLMTANDDIQSLEDLAASGGPIAVPGLDSPQAALVKKVAADQFEDTSLFDSQFQPMGHPDAVQAMRSGQVDAHFATPPFTYQEEDFGARELTNSTEILGTETTTVLFAAMTDWAEENSVAVDALSTCMDEARSALQEDPQQAAEWLAEGTGGSATAEEMAEHLAQGDITYTPEFRGIIEFAEMMGNVDMIESAPSSLEEIAFDGGTE